MCGIYGYVGTRTASPILLEGLRTLEYRGYDSAGVFVPGAMPVKAVGPIDSLAEKLTTPLAGTSGIAHTRWATHGAPTEANAHPHLDESGNIAVVHNGIIENYRELKEHLLAQGMTFQSETDSEVLAKLIGSLYRGDLRVAVCEALSRVRGAYGLAAVAAYEPGQVVVARLGSPIVIGLAPHGNVIASDTAALLAHTKDVVHLNDGECAVVTSDAYEVTTFDGTEQPREPEAVEWSVEAVQKNGYEHFMLKELNETPEVIENALRGRLLSEQGRAKLGGIEAVLPQLASAPDLAIVGCGSAYYAGLVGRHLLETYADVPTLVELASEYRYKSHPTGSPEVVLAVTQSGETADTLAAIRSAKQRQCLTLGVVNVVGSSVARETDAGVYNHAGPEIAVASTKAFISQLTVLTLIALAVGRERGLSREEGVAIAKALQTLPETIRTMLADTAAIRQAAARLAQYPDAMYIGRGAHAAIASEGALKLKEVSYIHAEAYAAGELKHGPIALLEKNFPVVALAPEDAWYEKMCSNLEEVKARGVPVIAVGTVGDSRLSELADEVILVPKVHEAVQPIVSTIPLQLLAYYVGVELGHNVDRPRNLAKSVTVE